MVCCSWLLPAVLRPSVEGIGLGSFALICLYVIRCHILSKGKMTLKALTYPYFSDEYTGFNIRKITLTDKMRVD